MNKGTVICWPNGSPAYEKAGNDDWDWWLSLAPEEKDKPEFIKDRNGKIARCRYGFKWTDSQIKEWFSFMTINST